MLKEGETFNNIVEKNGLLLLQRFRESTDVFGTVQADTAAYCQNRIVGKCKIWYDIKVLRHNTYEVLYRITQKGWYRIWIM